MRLVIALLLVLSPFAPAQTTPKRPKLVVGIMVDQFRYDYLIKFRDQYTGGLSRLLTHGAVFTNAFYEHFPTVTAIGHSTFMTGATPSMSGIVGNEWYDRETGKQVTSVTDASVTMLGGQSRGGTAAASPRRMLVSTIGDELKMAGRGSKVVGISVKDRSAILPVGHMADGAFWFDPVSGNFVSSTHYFPKLPGWVEDFNKSRYADKFVSVEWKPLSGGPAFKTMAAMADKTYFNSLEAAPYGNDLVEKFAEAAIAGEQLGRHNSTDLLAISFSSNDYIGHAVGPDDPQVRDVSIRTDRLLAAFFQYLESQVGMRNVLVVLSADHGVSPLAEVNQQRRMPGGRVPERAISDAIEARLVQKYGGSKWLVGRVGSSQYINTDLVKEKSLSLEEVAETAAQAAREVPHVFRAYSRGQLLRGPAGGDQVEQSVLRAFYPSRSPDVNVILEPYYVNDARGATHGSPFNYDTHVPVIFMGEGIRPGRYYKRIAPNDIAPTLATYLDIETPSGAMGRVLEEILQGGDSSPRRP